MRVVVGPVEVASATSWLTYAREVVEDLRFAGDDGRHASSDVLDVFEDYLTTWEKETDGKVFLWASDIPVEHLEYHVHAFQKVVEDLADRALRSGVSQAPLESEPFYLALVEGILAALRGEGPSHAEYAEQLRQVWPDTDA